MKTVEKPLKLRQSLNTQLFGNVVRPSEKGPMCVLNLYKTSRSNCSDHRKCKQKHRSTLFTCVTFIAYKNKHHSQTDIKPKTKPAYHEEKSYQIIKFKPKPYFPTGFSPAQQIAIERTRNSVKNLNELKLQASSGFCDKGKGVG